MSFLDILHKIDLTKLRDSIYTVSEKDVERVMVRKKFSITDFPVLLSPAAVPFLEKMAGIARQTTFLRFGKTVRLYAPLYVSNECVNACAYCGFNVNNTIDRITLNNEDIYHEAEALYNQGFRHILLVSGEDRVKVPVSYLVEIVRNLSNKFAAISIEVYPMDTEDYIKLVHCGVSGIALYQETYHREVYKMLHKGPKADFNYRLETLERAGLAGFRELGLGALIGLSDFRVDLTCIALHARYLMKKFWKSQIAISFPRLRFAAGSFKPAVKVSDRELAQTIFAFRMILPDVDLVLSTRENPNFRDGMAGIGITRISAGSKTNPGGYTVSTNSLEQFEVADTRSPAEITSMLERKGLNPVWKDFDPYFLFENQQGVYDE